MNEEGLPGIIKRARDATRNIDTKMAALIDEAYYFGLCQGIAQGYELGMEDREKQLMKEFEEVGTYEILVERLDVAHRAGYREGYNAAAQELEAYYNGEEKA